MLESTWFILWGILWAVYFMLDGFDLGLGTLMPFLAHNEKEKRTIYNAMGPFWDGNEVWLITAGGVTFAAFPTTYAVLFSSLYSALMLILFALIVRGITFEFRGKVNSTSWRKLWDCCMVVGSFLPALLFGVAFANIFRGIPIDAAGKYHGSLFTLLNPYGLLGGFLFLFLFLTHGALWLALKAEGPLRDRAISAAGKLWIALLIIAVLFLIATGFSTSLYINYQDTFVLLIIPIAAVVSLIKIRLFMAWKWWWRAWFASAATIVGCALFGVVGLYPNLLPSSINPAFNLTIRNSASSPLTLKIMLGIALTAIPIVIIYQVWVYNLFKKKINEKDWIY